MSDALATPAPYLPVRENVGRGAPAALVTVPVGVIAWVIVWGFGFVASIVGFVVALLALRLYLWGAGRISRAGAAVVLLTTTVTLLVAFFAGIDDCRFKRVVEPGDVLTLTCEIDTVRGPIGRGKATAHVDAALAARGTLTFAVER